MKLYLDTASVKEILEASVLGVLEHPLTDMGEKQFLADWNTQKSSMT